MNFNEILIKKQNSFSLTEKEINYIIENYMNNTINDDQMTLLLKAIKKNSMNLEETYYLTIAMLNSGEIIDLKNIEGIKIDKHSTGGVGDKLSLIILPILASLNIKCPKMSGKSLGHTGGTIDKLKSIDIDTDITLDEFIDEVNDINMAIIAQKNNLVPADKRLYDLRNRTNTVNSIPLIASSIMSKKLASGADKIFLDVKVGKGAFCNNIEEARGLAKLMVKIGKKNKKETVAILTNMNAPIGNNIGNSLEVAEALEFLSGKQNERLKEIVIKITAIILMTIENKSLEEELIKVEETLNSKEPLKYFLKFVNKQKGDLKNLKVSSKNKFILAKEDGYITSLNALIIGEVAKEIFDDYKGGIRIIKNLHDYVKKGDKILEVFYNEAFDEEKLSSSITITKEDTLKEEMVYEIIK